MSLVDRANFDQTSTLEVSKFGRSLVEIWSKFGRSLVEVSTLGVSEFGLIDDDRNNQKIAYLFKPKKKKKRNGIFICIKIAY